MEINLLQSISVFCFMPNIGQQEIDFATLCKEIRDHLELTQTQMAQRLGVSLRGYQRWEAGEREPSAQAAFRLARLQQELDQQNNNDIASKQYDNANDNNQIDKLLEITAHLQGEIAKLRLKHNKETTQ